MLVDDGDARATARKRSVVNFGSEEILLRAVQLGLINSRGAARETWNQLSRFDTHVPFEDTRLNDPALYKLSLIHI